MANFTTQEAEACILRRNEECIIGGAHHCYYIGVNDDNGNYYEWSDTTLVESPSAAQLKTAITDYLTGVEKKSVPVVISFTRGTAHIGNAISTIV